MEHAPQNSAPAAESTNSPEKHLKILRILAHDLRGSLQTLRILPQMLRMQMNEGDPKALKQTTTQMETDVERLYFSMEDLLQWSMLEVEGGKNPPEELQLRDTVDGVIQLVQGLYRKDQKFENNVGENLRVRLEPAVVSICLRNLLSNAAKFTPREGRIEVNAFRQTDKLHLVVTDYGTGMSEEQVQKLFVLQTRLRVRGTERESGSGLGLFLVRDLLKDLGGDLTVESMPGVGSSFTLILPIRRNTAVNPQSRD